MQPWIGYPCSVPKLKGSDREILELMQHLVRVSPFVTTVVVLTVVAMAVAPASADVVSGASGVEGGWASGGIDNRVGRGGDAGGDGVAGTDDGAGGDGDAGSDGATTWAALQSNGTELDPDKVVLEVQLQSDGSATWFIRYRVKLTNQSVADAFARVRADIEAGRLERAGRFKLQMESVVENASAVTGREMALRAVTVTAARRKPPGATTTYGVVTYEFEWTNFAEITDGHIRMGDALVDFFLTEDVTLLVTWPDGYRLVDSTPAPSEDRDDALVWKGPKEFTSDGPVVVIEPTSGWMGVTSPVDLGWFVAAVVGVLLTIVWYRRRGTGVDGTEEPTPGTEAAVDVDGTEPVADELLSDEERVIHLLEEHGGRMKQQAVVETLEWSETKTSQVVKDLHEAEKIERYRLGRENVLALPGEMDV